MYSAGTVTAMRERGVAMTCTYCDKPIDADADNIVSDRGEPLHDECWTALCRDDCRCPACGGPLRSARWSTCGCEEDDR